MTVKETPNRPARPEPTDGASPIRVAVVTPYHREELPVLERCHRSVLAQTVSCTHFLVADGPSDPGIEAWDCRRIALGVGHRDNGNTPRAIGGLCAMNEGFDCVLYLDADNWFAPDHVESILATQRESGAGAVFALRHLVFPDGEIVGIDDREDIERRHVDTSCVALFRPAFKFLSMWAEMPADYGPICDRVAFMQLTAGLRCAWTGRKTVYFETWYWGHFVAVGRIPPANAKFLPRRRVETWRRLADAYADRSDTPLAFLGPKLERESVRLVSILGAPRSGATALQRELCALGGFFGIPENDFLHRLRTLFGSDPAATRPGRLIIERFAELDCERAGDRRNSDVIDVSRVLDTDRTYTAASVHRQLLVRTAPARTQRMLEDSGVVRIVDRSVTASIAADLLFAVARGHHGLLMVRDPIEQICDIRRSRRNNPGPASGREMTIANLCTIVISHLLPPMLHAPADRLLVVSLEALSEDPDASLKRVAGFCGISVNPDPPPVRHVDGAGVVVNLVHQRELERIRSEIPAEIGDDGSCVLATPDPSMDPGQRREEALAWLSPQEYAFAATVFAPFHGGTLRRYRDSPHRESDRSAIVPQALADAASRLAKLLSSRLANGDRHVV